MAENEALQAIEAVFRIERSRPQDLERFLRENDLTDRIDFDINVPVSLMPETPAEPPQRTAA